MQFNANLHGSVALHFFFPLCSCFISLVEVCMRMHKCSHSRKKKWINFGQESATIYVYFPPPVYEFWIIHFKNLLTRQLQAHIWRFFFYNNNILVLHQDVCPDPKTKMVWEFSMAKCNESSAKKKQTRREKEEERKRAEEKKREKKARRNWNKCEHNGLIERRTHEWKCVHVMCYYRRLCMVIV